MFTYSSVCYSLLNMPIHFLFFFFNQELKLSLQGWQLASLLFKDHSSAWYLFFFLFSQVFAFSQFSKIFQIQQKSKKDKKSSAHCYSASRFAGLFSDDVNGCGYKESSRWHGNIIQPLHHHTSQNAVTPGSACRQGDSRGTEM